MSSAPEFFAVPIHWWICLDFNVTIDAGLAGEAQARFVSDPREERERVKSRH